MPVLPVFTSLSDNFLLLFFRSSSFFRVSPVLDFRHELRLFLGFLGFVLSGAFFVFGLFFWAAGCPCSS